MNKLIEKLDILKFNIPMMIKAQAKDWFSVLRMIVMGARLHNDWC